MPCVADGGLAAVYFVTNYVHPDIGALQLQSFALLISLHCHVYYSPCTTYNSSLAKSAMFVLSS